METFTQLKVTDYRQLSEAEIVLMNEGRALMSTLRIILSVLVGALTICAAWCLGLVLLIL